MTVNNNSNNNDTDKPKILTTPLPYESDCNDVGVTLLMKSLIAFVHKMSLHVVLSSFCEGYYWFYSSK